MNRSALLKRARPNLSALYDPAENILELATSEAVVSAPVIRLL